MYALAPDTPAHALPRVRSRAQMRARASGRSWPSARGCKTASKKISSFSRSRTHARCAPAHTAPRESALFLGAGVSEETYYNYYRTYQPNQGRYTQNDPIGLDGGWNRFGYGYQNSLSYTDPQGLLNSQVQDWLNQTRPDLSKCATAECKAGLLPTPKANPTACEMRCGTGSDDWAGRSLICGSIAAGGKLIGIPGIPVTLGCKIIDKRACIKKCEEESDPICRRD
jgi:RHS repeat-associated protein